MARDANKREKVLPPEWEIDWEIVSGMVGGYRRVRDGLKLQRDAQLGVWVLWMAQTIVGSKAVSDPPLIWADQCVPPTA